jgi:LacI family transcriptional regulator
MEAGKAARPIARKTIDDVAALAGVSIKTVSRVMNSEPGVRPETRNRVKAAISELNYRPSLPARSLAGKRSNLIGLIYDNPSANYVFDAQNGAIDRCREADLRLFIQSCNGLGDTMVDEVLAMVGQTHVDGLVITPPLSADRNLLDALDERRVPCVRIDPGGVEHHSPAVVMDDRAAAREMTALLLGLGHRRIGFVAGHPDHHSSRLRREGYEAALREASLDPGTQPVEQGYNDIASGTEAGRRMLELAEAPTAIFACNDDMAAGVIRAAHERGLDVPARLSVTGFDDSQIAEIVWPALTTIHQPTADMASAATGLLIDLLRGKEARPVTELAYTLVERGSTATAP